MVMCRDFHSGGRDTVPMNCLEPRTVGPSNHFKDRRTSHAAYTLGERNGKIQLRCLKLYRRFRDSEVFSQFLARLLTVECISIFSSFIYAEQYL